MFGDFRFGQPEFGQPTPTPSGPITNFTGNGDMTESPPTMEAVGRVSHISVGGGTGAKLYRKFIDRIVPVKEPKLVFSGRADLTQEPATMEAFGRLVISGRA